MEGKEKRKSHVCMFDYDLGERGDVSLLHVLYSGKTQMELNQS